MANTERLAALRKVREAWKAAMQAKTAPGTPAESRADLDRLTDKLTSVENTLILEEIAARVDDLRKDSKALQQLTRDMKTSVDHLQDVAARVQTAAQAIKLLVQIASKASSAGLL